MQCHICSAPTHPFGQAKMLNKYDVDYFQCSQCRFVQTETPYWLDEAYAEAITGSDIGLVMRNWRLAEATQLLMTGYFNPDAVCLDYGGGYGLFVRLMRDAGFDFFWYDKFCRNLFAEGFVGKIDRQYELVTAFELVEHLVDPQSEIAAMLKLSDSLLFSTELLPDSNPRPDQWWYYAPHEGQHIAIHTYESLQYLAKQLGMNLYSNHRSLHLLTRRTFPDDLLFNLGAIEPIDRPSLLTTDANKIFAMRQNPDRLPETPTITNVKASEPVKIIVDGVFFQLYNTGIARLWESVLREWSRSEFGQSIIVLDRAGSSPKIPGIQYLTIPALSYADLDADRALLQAVCDQENANLFISTYYTTPVSTPSVFMGYDMIPEVMAWDLDQPMWQSKHYAIVHADAYITISENTAADLQAYFPQIDASQVHPILCGVATHFRPSSAIELMQFRSRYNIHKPYFLLVGAGFGYKNVNLFIAGLAQLCSRNGFDVICTGSSAREITAEARKLMPDVIFHPLYLNDDELRSAYSGAVALVYPSQYEGFGLPVVEAMKCGCPVITCRNASLPEVGGDAVIYIDDADADAMGLALLQVQQPALRQQLIAAGQQQAQKFNWADMAAQIETVLRDCASQRRSTSIIVLIDWTQPEEQINTDLNRFFQIACGQNPDNANEFLIDTTGSEFESVDMMLSSGLMNFLMMQESSEICEPQIRLVEPIQAVQITRYSIVAKLQLSAQVHLKLLVQDIPEFQASIAIKA